MRELGKLGWSAIGLIVALASLLVLVVSTASLAATSLINERSYTLDEDAYWFNQHGAEQTKVVSYGGYEYTVWWPAADRSGDIYLKVGRRNLSTGTLETTTFREANGRLTRPLDAHNTGVVGISPNDGRLHVQWVDHNTPIKYFISEERCLSKTRFSECRFTFREETGIRGEARVTYPRYINAPGGELFNAYRSGNGTSGNVVMNFYNDNGTWGSLGTVLRGGTGTYDDGPGGLPTTTQRGPYVDSIDFDANGRIHLMWTWNEAVAPEVPGLDMHDVYYAYSDDGARWFDTAGTQVADSSRRDYITIEDTSTRVYEIPYGWWRSAQARMTLDNDNQPHVVLDTSDTNSADGLFANNRQMHLWRTVDGTWHSQWVEPAEWASTYLENGDIQFDRANNMYYIYPISSLDWFPYNRPEVEYNQDFPADHLVWDGSENLVIEPTSEITQFETGKRVNIPIGTRSTENRDIVIRMSNTTRSTEGEIYFTTEENQSFGEPQVQRFTARTEGALAIYTISMERVTNWRGTLRSLRIKPVGRTTAGSGRITIDYIRVQTGERRVAKEWEFRESVKMYVAESAGSDNWATWEITQVMSGVNLGWYDAVGYGDDAYRYANESGHKITIPTLVQGTFGNERMVLYEWEVGGDEVAQQWGFGADTIGWTMDRDITGFGWASDSGRGTLAGTVNGADARVVSPGLHLRIGESRRIRIRMKNSRTAGLRNGNVCWALNGRVGWRAEQCRQFPITADNAYHIYEITPPAEVWREQELTSLRVDPSDDEAVRTGSFNIDYVRIVD